MSRYLCVSVTFLDPAFHGLKDADQPEWPPSPHRLFQALLAGSHAGCRSVEWSDEKAGAFRWLEERAAPLIIAPDIHRSGGYTLFVPNNDGDKEPDRQDRLSPKIVKPQRMRGGEAVHYLWAIGEDEWNRSASAVEILTREARHLLALGWGIDHAFANGSVIGEEDAARIAGIRWQPLRHSMIGSAYRVPVPATLKDLDNVYLSFRNSVRRERYKTPLKSAVFSKISYVRETNIPRRACAEFEFPEEVAFRAESTVTVAAMLRSCACEAARKDTHEFPGGSEAYVAGHVSGKKETPERFSYLPLPTIGHPHADGMIRRVLIAEPYGGSGSYSEWARLRLRHQTLTDEQGRERAMLLEPWRTADVWSLYTRESRTWSSVTPVILPGHDDHDPKKKAPRLFLKAIAQAGITLAAVENFHIRKAPYWPGSQHPRQYRRPDYLKHLPAWHAWVRFREPIPGPLAIGAGRHCGLGIFANERSD